jgi:hypothetical protein
MQSSSNRSSHFKEESTVRQYFWILPLVLHWVALAATAQEYIVQVETLGYSNAPKAAAAPAEELLRSIEIVCRLDVLSRCEVKTGNEKMVLNVTLHRKSEDLFTLDIENSYSIETGDSYIDLSGAQVKRADETRSRTLMSVQIGRLAILGGLTTTRKNADDVERVSSWRDVVQLRKYEPPKDLPNKELPKQSAITPRREVAAALTAKPPRVRLSRDVHRRLLGLQ